MKAVPVDTALFGESVKASVCVADAIVMVNEAVEALCEFASVTVTTTFAEPATIGVPTILAVAVEESN